MRTRNDGGRSSVGRRTVLKAAMALGMALPARAQGSDPAPDPQQAPPQAGDRLVFAFGARAGEVVEPADLALGGPQIFAYPVEPSSGVVRNGSRLNQVLLVRLDANELSEETRARAAGGIVAYSAVCTHTGCDVEGWEASAHHFHCPCHDSEFDPRNGGQVASGPARRRLAALPITLVDGGIAVKGPFEGPLGAAEQ